MLFSIDVSVLSPLTVFVLAQQSELDLLYGIDKVHAVLDGLIVEGTLVETSRQRLAAPVAIIAASD